MQWEAPSKPLAVDDPLLLPEREVHAEISIDWFLDQDIPSHPKEGYVRILAELLLWEDCLGKTRIRTTEGLTTCMEPHREWTITSSSWIFLRKHGWTEDKSWSWSSKEQPKRTEAQEEAGYRSPTWSTLWALQKINKAKRLEGKAVMSAHPFFECSGRGDLKFWGEDDGPTVVVIGIRAGAEVEKDGHFEWWWWLLLLL